MNLCGNYVRLLCNNEGVYQYHIHFSPIIDNKRVKMRLLAEHKEQLNGGKYSFDGSILYMPVKLANKVRNNLLCFGIVHLTNFISSLVASIFRFAFQSK